MPSHPFVRVSLLCLALASLAGCSDDGGESTPTEACNDLVHEGPDVITATGTTAPTPMGGTIANGIYLTTAVIRYPDPGVSLPPDPLTRSGTFELDSGTLQAVTRSSFGDEEQITRYVAAYGATGTELTMTYVCPGEGLVQRSTFTATPNQLRLLYRVSNDRGTAELVLTKQ